MDLCKREPKGKAAELNLALCGDEGVGSGRHIYFPESHWRNTRTGGSGDEKKSIQLNAKKKAGKEGYSVPCRRPLCLRRAEKVRGRPKRETMRGLYEKTQKGKRPGKGEKSQAEKIWWRLRNAERGL